MMVDEHLRTNTLLKKLLHPIKTRWLIEIAIDHEVSFHEKLLTILFMACENCHAVEVGEKRK